MSAGRWLAALAVTLAVTSCASDDLPGGSNALDAGGAESSVAPDASVDRSSTMVDASFESSTNRREASTEVPPGLPESGSKDQMGGDVTSRDDGRPSDGSGGDEDARAAADADASHANDARSGADAPSDAGAADGSDGGWPTTTMAGAARVTGRHMGAAVASEHLDSPSEPQFTSVLTTHFDALVAEYQMKWGTTEPTRGQYTFAAGDAIIAFAARHGMIVKGHTLVWHNNLPAWVSALPQAELGPVLDAHIAGVVGHWKGKLYAWDVVNEAIADDGAGYRDTIFLQQLGAAYIERAFRAARAADPAALLFYNDYGAEGLNAKSNRIHTMLRDLKNAGVPLDGVGLQAHINGAAPPVMADIATNLDRLIALGLSVNFSEIDIRMGGVTGTAAEKLAKQRTLYHDLIALCAARPKCHSATTWGFTDKYTWIDAQYGAGHVPLPFDVTYAAKPAVAGVIDAWLGK
jgi:GH35 family endo-1,4-beta-xylanase